MFVANAVNVAPASVCVLCIVTIVTNVPLANLHTSVISGAQDGTNGCEPCVLLVNVPSTLVFITVI